MDSSGMPQQGGDDGGVVGWWLLLLRLFVAVGVVVAVIGQVHICAG